MTIAQGGGCGEGGVLTNCNTGPVGTTTWHQSHHNPFFSGHSASRMHFDSLQVYCLYLEVADGPRSLANVLFCCYVVILLSLNVHVYISLSLFSEQKVGRQQMTLGLDIQPITLDSR